MRIDFIQGIIVHPATGVNQTFLVKSGVYVNLSTANGHTDIAFAHGTSNYLLSESSDVNNAWGPVPDNTDVWLFWDINTLTAVRTFGFTLLLPITAASAPVSPGAGQHWFDTVNKKMFAYESGNWRNVIRVFAAKLNNTTFFSLGSSISKPYAGSQVGIFTADVPHGRIIVDELGSPVRRQAGQFFTSEDEFFTNGSPVNTIKLEANILNATALETMAKYYVVKYTQFGKVNLAGYNDLQNTAIAMLMQDLLPNQTGTVITQGIISNPAWNWQTVGALLWVSTGGLLVEIDPHVSSVITYPVSKPPVGRVITATSIIFDQGLGGKGDVGPSGLSGIVSAATTSVAGTAKMSVAPASASNPIAVSTNDPRMTDARVPLAHNQAASTVTFTPYGPFVPATSQLALQQLYDTKVNKAGDVMTGLLTLSANPTTALHAVTKQYVDAAIPLPLGFVPVNKAGDVMTGLLTLSANPTTALHAVTKQYVDSSTASVVDNLFVFQIGVGGGGATHSHHATMTALQAQYLIHNTATNIAVADSTLVNKPQSSPIQIPGTTWNTAATGYGHSAATRTDGTLWVWGLNFFYGQLGDGTRIDKSSPIQIPGTTWNNVVGGYFHTIATKTDGTLWAWGRNSYGQLGDGTRIDKSSPIQIPGTTWNKIDASYGFTIATRTDGTLWTWGNNVFGHIGDGTLAQRSSPVQVPGTTWNNIASGSNHVLATKTDGTLWAWGFNSYGQLGDGTRIDKSSPIQIPGTTWNTAATGYGHSTATRTDGTLWTWGRNTSGQLGDGTIIERSSPIQIPGTTWNNIASSDSGTLATKTDGTLWAWGSNYIGQIGDETIVPKSSPVQIPGTTWNKLSGAAHTLAIKTDNTLWAWGNNYKGQLAYVLTNQPSLLLTSEPNGPTPHTHTITVFYDYTVGSFVVTNITGNVSDNHVALLVGSLKSYIDTQVISGRAVAGAINGTIPASAKVLMIVFTNPFTIAASLTSTTLSSGRADIVGTVAAAVFDIRRNNISVGTMTFAVGTTVAIFSFPVAVTFAGSETLTIVAPATPNATLADVYFTIQGTLA